MKKTSKAVIGLVVVAALLVVSSMSHDDEVANQNYYCEMVASGDWPNYKNINCAK